VTRSRGDVSRFPVGTGTETTRKRESADTNVKDAGGISEDGREPCDGAAGAVALVGGLGEVVAFVLVDDELGFDAESFSGRARIRRIAEWGIRRRCRRR